SKILVARNIPGIILHGFGQSSDLQGMDWDQFAVVEMKNYIMGQRFHRVAVNAYQGFYMMICKAFALGYKRVGVATSRQYDRRFEHGVLFPVAFAKDRLRAGQSLESLVLASHSRREEKTIQDWLRQKRPEIVIGVDLIWNAIEAMGWQIPGDVAFINVDRRDSFPHTAGFNQRIEVQIEKAVDLLVAQINANHRGVPKEPILQLVDGCWEDGASAPPAAERHRPRPVTAV
ncbi:MAG: LacI family transcriptional regulator, partial [Verrucomicrobiota bacterium]